jgi:hypothetical protein
MPYFAIFISGHQSYSTEMFDIPTLHFYGMTDYIIQSSFLLSSMFKHAKMIPYQEGHKIPYLTSVLWKELSQFISEVNLQEKLRRHELLEQLTRLNPKL